MTIFLKNSKKKKLKQRKVLSAKYFKEKEGKTTEKRKREDTTGKDGPVKKRKTAKAAFQAKLDTPLIEEIKKHPQLGDYLKSRFFLTEGQFPHALKF